VDYRYRFAMRTWGLATACVCAAALAAPGTASAGWGPAEPVEHNINEVLLAPGGPGFIVETSEGALRFALRPFAGPVGVPTSFPTGIGTHSLPTWGFDAAGDAVVLDEEVQMVAWRSAAGDWSTPQKLAGHLLARWPRLVSVAPNGDALIGVNEERPGGSPVQLAFRPAGAGSAVDTENTLDLTTKGTIVGLQLQADGGAIAVYWDEVTGALMQVVRRSGQKEFDAPTEVKSPGDPGKVGVVFDGDPSGWAMLGWIGSSQKGGPLNEVLGSVRAPDGSFPTATVTGAGTNLSNVSPAVTAAGDGLLTWADSGFGECTFKAGAIMGASEHLGGWAASAAVGPSAWPDISVPATASTSFSSGNDISVPMIRIHRDGSPCPGAVSTRSLIVHHYRSGPSGLTDQGTSELTPLLGNFPTVFGWAMEPAGKILAWYNEGEERFLSVFDGVTPGGSPAPETPAPKTSGPKTSTPILPLKLQQFAIIPTISPKDLEFEMRCPPPSTDGQNEDICAGRAEMLFVFTGKHIRAFNARAGSVKRKVDVIATGSIKIKAGHSGRVKLRPNRLGKALLKTGAKLKVTLKLSVSLGHRSITGSLPATIKARKRR
jgi:hypothetical protein